MFKTTQLFILLSIAAAAAIAVPGRAQSAPPIDAPARCTALGTADFSQIPDALTQVTAAKPVDAAAAATDSGYCEVSGYVAASVGFLLRLPVDGWNGKFIELGCGGACGSTRHISMCGGPLRRGYACIVSDGGHSSTGSDVKWAYNNPQSVIDYFIRASHVTALAGKAIAQRYYDRAPAKSYFMGCSAGGIQAMWLAQRFPWDFDGIAAGGPCPSLPAAWMNLIWGKRVLTEQTGKPLFEQADLERVHQAVVAKCDLDDGVRDGVIGDPRTCRFDPAELRCAADRDGQCLTPQQIEAVRKVYGGPVTSSGVQIVPPAAQKGSERTWLQFYGGSPTHPTPMYNYTAEWFRYYLFQPNPGPAWTMKDFDFDRDYKRLGAGELVDWASNPDLRRFKAAGGKLLSYTSWNDAVEGVLGTVDYYESAQKIMGGRAQTQDFFRLFVVPGMNHCGGGEGASVIDWLTYLEAWVEAGQAPDKIVGAHLKGETAAGAIKLPLDPATIEFSRPIYPYPIKAKYSGRGDPNDASSFGPIK